MRCLLADDGGGREEEREAGSVLCLLFLAFVFTTHSAHCLRDTPLLHTTRTQSYTTKCCRCCREANVEGRKEEECCRF